MNRAKAQGLIIKRMKDLDKSGKNAAYYEDLLTKMSNAEFDNFMKAMIDGTQPLSVIIPNYSDVEITVDNNIKLARELHYEFYQHIWTTDPTTGIRFLTPRKHLVFDVPVCRQTQTLDHKISVPKDNSRIDEATGQPTGDSRSSQLSGPEFMILKAQGYDSSIVELIKFRGGDNQSMRMMDQSLIREGAVSMNAIPGAPQRTNKSVRTLSSILNGMMLSNNFAG